LLSGKVGLLGRFALGRGIGFAFLKSTLGFFSEVFVVGLLVASEPEQSALAADNKVAARTAVIWTLG